MVRQLGIPTEESESQENIPSTEAAANVIERKKPRRIGEFVERPEGKENRKNIKTGIELFTQGLQRSAAGELVGAAEELPEHPEGFWNSVIEESGNLVGDAPFMAIGATIGGSLGATAGPVGAIVGGGFGAMALPAFLKEASREYRNFQDRGGNLTFGDYLESAGQISSSTLREGAFGVILGSLKHAMPLLRKIPAVDKLFNTRYVGPVTREATELGAEVGVASVVPPITEGRLPTAEDTARAAVLFAGGRVAHLPGQLMDAVKDARSERFNYALADRIQKLDLAYPPLAEFRKNHNPIYKNSVELDRNLTAFDQSFVNNMVSRINFLSNIEFVSADQAGRAMKEVLSPLTAVEIPPNEPVTPEPTKPIERPIPLIQNPIRRAVETLGNAAPSKAELGRRIIRQYNSGRNAEQEPLNQRYQQQRNEMIGLDVVDNDLAQEIQTFIDRFEPGAIPGSQAATIVANARILRDLFIQYDAEGNIAGYRSVPMQQLISTNRSIKQIPNWDVPPEMLDNLGPFTQQIDAAIIGHLENINPDLAIEYQQLNADYTLFKNRWDNDDMRIFYDRTSNNEAVANKFSRLDDFTQLSQAFEGTYEGQQVLNLLRREVWQERLGRDVINARNEADFEKATRDLTMRQFRDLMEFLTPEQREIALQAMQRSNQIRTSAIRSSEQFSRDEELYKKQMNQWKEQEGLRKEKEKKLRQDVQMKQELLVSLLQEDPAKLVGNMESIEGIRRIKEATSKVADGQKLYDSLARYETERMFDFMREGYLRTDRVPYTELKLRMKDKEFRAKLKELNGDKFVREMDELIDITDDLSKNFKDTVVKFKDDPSTLNTILHIYTILGLAQGNIMTPLMAFTAKKSLLRIGGKAYNMWTDKRNYDQEHIHRILNAARAAKKGNKKEIRRQEAMLNLPFIRQTESSQGTP